ncbi:MAG: LPS export ABC transporter periplasmic protein LptC [Chitinophagales bacterium]
MFKFSRITFALLIVVSLVACENNMKEVEKVAEKLQEENIERIKDVEIIYSEEGKVKVQLTAPSLLGYKNKKEPRTEFSEGLKVVFFDKDLQKTSSLVGNYGIRYEKEKKTTIRENVVWVSETNKQKLETEELNWNERTQKIYSEKFVKVTTETETIFGEGFEANQDFSRYKIKQIKGTIKVNPDDYKGEE